MYISILLSSLFFLEQRIYWKSYLRAHFFVFPRLEMFETKQTSQSYSYESLQAHTKHNGRLLSCLKVIQRKRFLGWVEMDRFVIRTSENLILFPGPDHTNWGLWLLEWRSSFSGLLSRYITHSNTADCKGMLFLKERRKIPCDSQDIGQKNWQIWDEEQLWRIKRRPEH